MDRERGWPIQLILAGGIVLSCAHTGGTIRADAQHSTMNPTDTEAQCGLWHTPTPTLIICACAWVCMCARVCTHIYELWMALHMPHTVHAYCTTELPFSLSKGTFPLVTFAFPLGIQINLHCAHMASRICITTLSPFSLESLWSKIMRSSCWAARRFSVGIKGSQPGP